MSRQQELAGSKPEKEIQLDASKASLVVKEQAAPTDISIASDLALFQAIQRRSLAMDQVDGSFVQHLFTVCGSRFS